MRIPSVTTMAGFHALVFGIASLKQRKLNTMSLQKYCNYPLKTDKHIYQ
jgi:hypothetical protein